MEVDFFRSSVIFWSSRPTQGQDQVKLFEIKITYFEDRGHFSRTLFKNWRFTKDRDNTFYQRSTSSSKPRSGFWSNFFFFRLAPLNFFRRALFYSLSLTPLNFPCAFFKNRVNPFKDQDLNQTFKKSTPHFHQSRKTPTPHPYHTHT